MKYGKKCGRIGDKPMKKIIIAIIFILSLLFVEYRFIMHNIHPYIGENNTVYLEIFEQVDEYYAEDYYD
jgi:hypothetical protein